MNSRFLCTPCNYNRDVHRLRDSGSCKWPEWNDSWISLGTPWILTCQPVTVNYEIGSLLLGCTWNRIRSKFAEEICSDSRKTQSITCYTYTYINIRVNIRELRFKWFNNETWTSLGKTWMLFHHQTDIKVLPNDSSCSCSCSTSPSSSSSPSLMSAFPNTFIKFMSS